MFATDPCLIVQKIEKYYITQFSLIKTAQNIDQYFKDKQKSKNSFKALEKKMNYLIFNDKFYFTYTNMKF